MYASAGNIGQGLAYAARAQGVAAMVFAAAGANPLKLAAMRRFGADVRLAGHNLYAAKAASRDPAAETGKLFFEDGLHPAIAEGAGSIGDGIAVRVRVPEALAVTRATVDDVVEVEENALLRGCTQHWRARD
jgi:threonine dehydratase